jgi:hypothetical protein
MVRGRSVLLAAAVVGLTMAPASGQVQPGLSKPLQKCESGTGSALSKFVGAKTKCITKCTTGGRKTSGPYTDCFAPYGGDTLTCITGSLKGAEAKGGAAIAKVCAASDACPMCYVNFFGDGTPCTDASGGNPWVQLVESAYVDSVARDFYCEESGIEALAATPSKSEAKCEDGVAKALAKGWSSETKCFQKCNTNLASGKISGSCDPLSLTDPTTIACVSDPTKGVLAKTAAAIDKACFTPPATAPSCYTDIGATSGAIWATLVSGSTSFPDQFVSFINCGSPSGAFLD